MIEVVTSKPELDKQWKIFAKLILSQITTV